ncbi:MAG TPA: TPM domain-containing protein, partial [Caulobacteraceae bacterium]|nr:TPM domain-containing protein [Caulobacteraceae bacterium]
MTDAIAPPLPPNERGRGWGLASLLLVLVAALSFFAPVARAAPTFPPLTGRVVDDAHVLSAQTVTDLTAKLADLETKTGRQVVVVTLPDLQGDDIEDYGYQLGRAWGIGQKGQNNGVLFIVVPSEHKVRIEVGYGLEPVMTDAMSSLILQEQVLPKFRAGDVEGGVTAGANAIIQQLSLDQAAATANVQKAAQASQPHGIPFGAIFGLIVLFIVFSSLFRRHWGGGGMGWWLPMMIMSSGSRGSGWGGGGWSGGSGGGFGGG